MYPKLRFTLSLLLILSCGGLLLIANPFSEWRILGVASDSMAPSIYQGSLLLIKKQAAYQVGDVISYRINTGYQPTLITHRVVSVLKETRQVTTKGDANDHADTFPVLISDVVGRVYVVVPKIGWLLFILQTPLGLTLVIIVPGTILLWEEIKNLIVKV